MLQNRKLRWIRVGQAVSLLLIVLGGTVQAADIPSFDRVRVLESPKSIDAGAFTDQDGQPFTFEQLDGRVALVFFGYTSCPDVCPLAMESLRQFREAWEGDSSRIAVVMVSVDGENDSPEVMKTFLNQYGTDFIGLTADPGDVKRFSSQFSVAFFKRNSGAHGDYAIAHSPQIFLLDAQRRLRAELYSPSLDAMLGVTQALLESE